MTVVAFQQLCVPKRDKWVGSLIPKMHFDFGKWCSLPFQALICCCCRAPPTLYVEPLHVVIVKEAIAYIYPYVS